jgi:hypothetical protein
MDTLHGHDIANDQDDFDYAADAAIETPPVVISDERRMQVRAYNHWASMLGERSLPSIEDLSPDELGDFGPNSVLLDFSTGIDNPAIVYLGTALRRECEVDGTITHIDDVPAQSLLSQLTDHYRQIIANAAPIGFESEFINQRGSEILSRGILMPFSSNNDRIDYIYGVINWKEVASHDLTDALMSEMEQALRTAPTPRSLAPVWTNAPTHSRIDKTAPPRANWLTLPRNGTDASARPDSRAALKAAQPLQQHAITTDSDGLAVVVARRESDGSLSIVATLPGPSTLFDRVVAQAVNQA